MLVQHSAGKRGSVDLKKEKKFLQILGRKRSGSFGVLEVRLWFSIYCLFPALKKQLFSDPKPNLGRSMRDSR